MKPASCQLWSVCVHVCTYWLISLIQVTYKVQHSKSINWMEWSHGRRSRGGQGDTSPPEFGVGGTIMQIVPRRFCRISTKMTALWPSKYAKIRFRPGLRPGPRWGSSRRSPRPPSRLKLGTPLPIPYPHSAPIHLWPLPCVPPRIPARSTPMLLMNSDHKPSFLGL